MLITRSKFFQMSRCAYLALQQPSSSCFRGLPGPFFGFSASFFAAALALQQPFSFCFGGLPGPLLGFSARMFAFWGLMALKRFLGMLIEIWLAV